MLFAALAKDPGLVLSTYMVCYNLQLWEIMYYLLSSKGIKHTYRIDTYMKAKQVYIN